MYIDVRSRNKYLLGHIDGAINIDFYELMISPDKYLNKEMKYYIYCDTGTRSKILVFKLNKMGYDCVNVNGGYNNYMFSK